MKPGRIIELLLKIVNVLRMRPGFGVVHGDQPARHGYGGIRSVGTFFSHLVKSAKRFCVLKDVKDPLVSKLGSGSARSFALARDQVFYF